VAEHTDLDFADQRILSAYFVLLNQAYSAQLLEVMLCDAWTAEVQGLLDFAGAEWASAFQEKPVDFPVFSAKSILEFGFVSSAQGVTRLSSVFSVLWLIIPNVSTDVLISPFPIGKRIRSIEA